jgi:hypothetical protein
MRYCIRIIFVFALLPLVVSCASQINGSLGRTGQAELAVGVFLQPRMTTLLRMLAAASGSATADGPILDGTAIAASMSAAPGIASVSFRNTSPVAIEGPVRISQIGDFLAPGSESGGFIVFEQGASGGRCIITLSRETGPRILSLISPEIAEYLNALMAPLATGELLSKAEYLDLINTVYGKSFADEISQSFIRASIEFPGPIQAVRGGTFQGRRADFAVPLPDLLVLETPLICAVTWQ